MNYLVLRKSIADIIWMWATNHECVGISSLIVVLRSQVSNALVSASIKFIIYSFILRIILLLQTCQFPFILLFYNNDLNGISFPQLGMEGKFYKCRDSSY